MKIDRSMFGDMAIKDLSPKDANSSGRIIKNLRICGSGLYEYHVSEAPLMGLQVPDDYNGDTFKIFRSPEVLEQNKELYARVPIITGHHVRVNTANAKQLAVGMIGDTVQSEIGSDGELYLYTTGTIITGDGIEAYEKYGELSVGYDPIVKWSEGEYKGEKYQAVLEGFNEINHVLICKTARGGHQCMIMDSIDNSPLSVDKPLLSNDNVFKHINVESGGNMGIFKKIFGTPATKNKMAGDAKVMSAILQSVKAGADCKTQVEAVKKMVGDSADDTLKGYFEDLTGDEVGKADKDTLFKAIDVVDAYVQKLCGDEQSKDDKPKAEESGDTCHTAEPPAGDEEHPEDCTCESCTKSKSEDKKSNGDAIDYDLIAQKVADILKPKAEEKSNGDELEDNVLEASRVAMLLAGDEKSEAAVSSDTLMKEIWG